MVGTVEDYANSEAVRESVKALITRSRPADRQMKPLTMTVGELCRHFEQRELAQEDTWRSYSTRRNYHFLLKRWIIPRWGSHELSQVSGVVAAQPGESEKHVRQDPELDVRSL